MVYLYEYVLHIYNTMKLYIYIYIYVCELYVDEYMCNVFEHIFERSLGIFLLLLVEEPSIGT